jgi:hypothetical protein
LNSYYLATNQQEQSLGVGEEERLICHIVPNLGCESMVEYESKKVLYSFIGMPNNPKMHWSHSLGWIMAKFMFVQMINAIPAKVYVANYVVFMFEEVNIVDYGSWISIHAYVMQHWVRVSMLISLQRVVDGIGANNLTIVFMEALQKGRGLSYAFITHKLFCFGANGVISFQGTKIGLTKQINTNYAPFSIGVHCMAHRCNLAFKTLSSLGIISSIEDCYKLVMLTLLMAQKRPLSLLSLLI